MICVGSTGVDHEDGFGRDPAHDWTNEAMLRDEEVSPIMSNWLLVRTWLISIRLVIRTVLVL